MAIKSPVKIYNEYLDEAIKLPTASFTGGFIGPVTPIVFRELGELTSVPATFDLVYEEDEEALVLEKYRSPNSKRQYVTLSEEIYIIDSNGDEYALPEGQYSINPSSITITDNIVYIGDIEITDVEGTGPHEITVASFITNLNYTLRTGDKITDGTNVWTITAINRNSLTVTLDSGSGAPPVGLVQVNRAVTGTVKAKYRVFKKFNEVIKIDDTGKLKRYFGEIDDQNILPWAISLAFDSMEAPKAVYAIPYSSQDNPTEAFERLRSYQEPNVYLIDNVVLDFNEDVLNAAKLLAIELAKPEYSTPIRFFIAYDAPPYKYEWMPFDGTISALKAEIDDADEGSYVAIGTDPDEDGDITSASFNGKILEFVTPINLTAGSQYVLKFDDVIIKWTADAAYTAGDTVITADFEVVYGNLNPTKVRNAVSDPLKDSLIGPLEMYPLNDTTWDLNDIVFAYSVIPVTDIATLYGIYTSKSPNSEFINIVNPWIIKKDGTRAPGFYLAAMKAGLTIGKAQLVMPTSFWPLPRDYAYDVDYDLNFWGNYYELVLDKGFDLHVVYNNELISWKQRTSYSGLKIDKKYQHAVRAVIITNYYQRAAVLPFVRKYTLDSFTVNTLLTSLNQVFRVLMRKELGPVLSAGSRVKDIYLINSPNDIPEDIPVMMESGLIIVSVLRIPRMIDEIIIYNAITREAL